MAYEYENMIVEDYNTSGYDLRQSNFFKVSKEIQEVYRKAKAFDKISNLIEENYVDYGENNLEDVEAIVNEYWEDE